MARVSRRREVPVQRSGNSGRSIAVAASFTTWGAWVQEQPATLVLDAPGGVTGFDLEELVIVIDLGSEAAADPGNTGRWSALSRRLDDRIVGLSVRSGRILDEETGTEWDAISGVARQGPSTERPWTCFPRSPPSRVTSRRSGRTGAYGGSDRRRAHVGSRRRDVVATPIRFGPQAFFEPRATMRFLLTGLYGWMWLAFAAWLVGRFLVGSPATLESVLRLFASVTLLVVTGPDALWLLVVGRSFLAQLGHLL